MKPWTFKLHVTRLTYAKTTVPVIKKENLPDIIGLPL